MKSYDEIILNYAEPMIKSIQKFAEILEKEPDVESHKGKKSLLLFLNDIVDNFSVLRDGNFEASDYEVPSVSIDGSLGNMPIAIDEPIGSANEFDEDLRSQGLDPDAFDDIEDDDEDEYYDEEEYGA